MKKLLLLLFIPILCFGQEDIERYKIYNTTNIFTSLLLDSATGQIWQLQIGLKDVDQMKSVLSDYKYANTVDYYTQEHNDDMKYWEEEYSSKPDSIVSVENNDDTLVINGELLPNCETSTISYNVINNVLSVQGDCFNTQTAYRTTLTDPCE